MQPSKQAASATTEDAVMGALMVFGRRMRQRLADDVLDFSQVPVLKALDTFGAMRLSALATALELDASTVSRHVKQLEDRGYLGRTTDPDDGRASQIAITAAGRHELRTHIERRRALIATALNDWSASDREVFRTLLDRMTERMMHP